MRRQHQELGDRNWPVQQVQVKMVSAGTGEARRASARDAVSRHVMGLYLGDKEYAVALTDNRAADQFLGAAVAVILQVSINVIPSERPVRSASCSAALRMSSLPEVPRALTERRDDGAIVELYRTP